MALTWSTVKQHHRLLRRIIIAAVAFPIAWYTLSPYFISQTVNEAPPPVASRQQSAAAGQLSGQFTEVDPLHKGEGRAVILTQADGSRVLRFEDFKVTNGPDLYVYLSGHPMPRNRDQLHQNEVELGRLKGNVGSQNYELPAGFDLASVTSVVIYCKQFSFIFSSAELTRG